MWQYNYSDKELYHHGILGMKWGVRRFQNKDGTLTPQGRIRYYEDARNRKNDDLTKALAKEDAARYQKRYGENAIRKVENNTAVDVANSNKRHNIAAGAALVAGVLATAAVAGPVFNSAFTAASFAGIVNAAQAPMFAATAAEQLALAKTLTGVSTATVAAIEGAIQVGKNRTEKLIKSVGSEIVSELEKD